MTYDSNPRKERIGLTPAEACERYWKLRRSQEPPDSVTAEDNFRFVMWFEREARRSPLLMHMSFFLDIANRLWFQLDGKPEMIGADVCLRYRQAVTDGRHP